MAAGREADTVFMVGENAFYWPEVAEAARRIDAGMVAVNRPVIIDPAAPFGGMKQSGLGREGASEGILEFLEETHPSPPLLPAEPVLRAKTRQLVEVVNSSIHPVQNLKVMRQLTQDFGTDRPANFDWARRWIERHFHGLEALVDAVAGAHAVGDAITLADIAIVPQVFNARRFGVDMDLFPRLTAVDAAVSAHPAFEAAAPERQPDFEA